MEGCRGLHANSWRLWWSSHRAIWKDMTNTLSLTHTHTHTHTHSLFLHLLKHTFTSKHRVPLHHAQVSVIPGVVSHSAQSFWAEKVHWDIGLPAYLFTTYTLHLRRQSPLPPPAAAAAAAAAVEMVVVMKQESVLVRGRRVAGRGADKRNTPSQLETKERPAKGPIAQSWLTQQCTSHTFTHIHTHAHT